MALKGRLLHENSVNEKFFLFKAPFGVRRCIRRFPKSFGQRT